MPTTTLHCDQCRKALPHNPHSIGTGYATTDDGKRICYACCAVNDRAKMIKTGHSRNLPLYLSGVSPTALKITNWPSSLTFMPNRIRHGRHNIARARTDVWFNGPDGFVWHGTQYGNDYSDICHCKRTKQPAAMNHGSL